MTLGLNTAILMLIVGCSTGASSASDSPGAGSRELTVFAAASLANAFPEVAEAFRREHPGVSVNFNFAGSQRLRTQLEFGARGDIFASADQRQMDLADDSGLLSGESVIFTTNRLVVIVPKETTGQQDARPGRVRSLADLANKSTKLALALPEVPAGGYARTAILHLGEAMEASTPDYAGRTMANVVSLEPNVRGVVGKVALNEVDAGIVYWSDANTRYATSKVTVIPIPEASNVVATYPIAVLKGSAEPALAQGFVLFRLSRQAQSILEQHGFGPSAQRTGSNAGSQRGSRRPKTGSGVAATTGTRTR